MSVEEKIEHNEAVYEPIFATSRGSVYFYDELSNLWIRRKKTGQIVDDRSMYIGSVGHDAEMDVLQVFRDMDNCLIKDFLPEFAAGRDVFGISFSDNPALEGRDIGIHYLFHLGPNNVTLRDGLNKEVGIHRGHTISEVYREFNPLKEYRID